MFRRFSVNFALFSMALDAVLVAISLSAANQMRPLLRTIPFAATVRQAFDLPDILYPLFALIWVAIFSALSVYDGRRNLRITNEVTNLSLGSLLAGISLAGTLYFTYRDVSRILFLTFVAIASLSLLSWRLIARLAFRLNRGRSMQMRRVLIIGAGPVGQELKDKINHYPHLGLTLVGFLDDDPLKQSMLPDVCGSLDDARKIIKEKEIHDVVIALPRRAYEKVNRLVAELHDQAVKVWVIPDYFHLALHKAVVEDFAGIPMLDLRAPALNDYQRMIKRAFDLTITILILPPSLILMGIIALAIRLESPGPVLFRQKRVGENGRLFEMLKFRSMVRDAEELRHLVERKDDNGNLIHKSSQDPRVTRIGRILRNTSLDELPQLFNVLKGEMSLIGPRPELPYLVESYEPWQRKRFAVPQGITGWWQVNGRSDRLMHMHTEDDLYYVQNYSLLLDVQILIKTIGVVLRGRGAF